MAPEMIYSEGHDHTVDNWSLGVLLYELLSLRTPFSAPTPAEVAPKILLAGRGAGSQAFRVDEADMSRWLSGSSSSSVEDDRAAIKLLVEGLMHPQPSQ